MKVRVAAAGTGKTTSLVARFLERIGEGVPLRRIAGVTFTRSAAAELRERVGEGIEQMIATGRYLGDLVNAPDGSHARYEEARRELQGATLTTIHGFMRLGLRHSAPLLGLDPEFTSLPEWEAEAIFGEELAGLLLLAGDPDHPLHSAALRLGSRAGIWAEAAFKARSLSEALEPAPGDLAAHALTELYRAAYARYQARTGATRLAPSEIERRALAMTRTPHALARLAERAPYVVVDEYQDVNPLQGRFFAALEAGGVHVEVVGDPKQSIYGFRHADVEVFRAALHEGEALAPLTQTRRHAATIAYFLNRLTHTLAERGWGFGPDEAPPVTPAGAQADVMGRLEVHWATGAATMNELRPLEADVLAQRLAAAHEAGTPWSDMAVIARSYAILERFRATLARHTIPAVLRQGRGYYERSEIRDLVHALQVGIDPRNDALAAWLRGPFAGLRPADVDAALRADDLRDHLRRLHPEVATCLERTEAAILETPLNALRILLREPMMRGRRYVDLLDDAQRENVDALLFDVAERPPGELDVLLERLDLLARRSKETGDVPQEGDGVTLITAHGSKGLEWPLVAVVDLGAGDRPQRDTLLVHEGTVHLIGGPGFLPARSAARERERNEQYRLLYVAASRARDTLLLTGSVSGEPRGWARALDEMKLGPGQRHAARPDFLHAVHRPGSRAHLQHDPLVRGSAASAAVPNRPTAAWTHRRFEAALLPPVESPSRVRQRGAVDGASHAPRSGGGRLPGQAATVGTLLHDAIRRDAHPSNEHEIELLRAQEIMFPYEQGEQDQILEEIRGLLATYHALLGDTLPRLDARDRDLREWPVALPDGSQVWQGVIDRLYLANGSWFLDDYKTDRSMDPERYAFQLAVYREAVRLTLGVDPVTRLVNLRDGTVHALTPNHLDRAWSKRPVRS